jgi:hypothetical protein
VQFGGKRGRTLTLKAGDVAILPAGTGHQRLNASEDFWSSAPIRRRAAAGRVVYQIALTATENDNGFVTMFFLIVPGLSSFISFILSSWISDLHFAARWMFFVDLALVAAPLFVFSMKSKKIE